MVMVLGQSTLPAPKLPPLHPPKRNTNNDKELRPTCAKKPNTIGSAENSQHEEPTFSLRVPNALLARSAVAVFGLGFIDAGYSGDWSRVGAISKETEDLLKIAAYVVVPSCLLLAHYISDKKKDM